MPVLCLEIFKAVCRQKNATLAEITSEEEFSFVIQSVESKLKHLISYFFVMLKIFLSNSDLI